tara:strand:- start:547 stop:942 length:396 start_codon:yes stop_codon:yes gene_type:complete
MRRPRRDTIRSLYRDGLLQVFGCNDKELDSYLTSALKRDIHIAGNAPGEWVSSEGVLEIYCEGGIPNATDVFDFSFEARELGLDTSSAVTYNSDKWFKVDSFVNLGLKAMGYKDRVHHEPHNGAVVAVHWS